MGRKQKRKQKDPYDGGADRSSDSSVCNHAKLSLNIGKVRKKVLNYKNQCEVCDKLNTIPEVNEKFVCLQCGTFTCSLEHSQVHFETVRSDPHDLVYSVVQEKVWCHKCSVEISPKIATAVNSCITQINSILKKNVVKSEDSSSSKLYGAESKQETSSTIVSPLMKIDSSADGFPAVRGLTNLGNTCFFNSVLQCLARTPNLLEELRKMEKPGRSVRVEFKNGRVLAGELGKWDHLTETLAKVLQSLTEQGSSNGVVNPSGLLAALRKKHSQFEGYDQHDAHELLRLLLDSVRSAEQRRYRALLFPELGMSSKTDPSAVPKELGRKARDLDHQMSQVVTFTPEHIFKGLLVSKLECQECSHSTECEEGFLDLSLPIAVDKQQPPSLRKWSSGGSVEKKVSQDGSTSQASMSSTAKKKARRRVTRVSSSSSKRGKTETEVVEEEKDSLPDLARLSLSPSRGDDETCVYPDDGDVEDNDEPTKSDDRRRESGYSSEKGESYSSPRGSPALDGGSLTQATPCDEDSARVSPNPLSVHEPFWHGNLDDFKHQMVPQPNKAVLENDLTTNDGWSQTRNPIPLLEDETPDFSRMFSQNGTTEKVQVLCRDSKTIMEEGGIEEGNGVNERWFRRVSEPAHGQIQDAWNEDETLPLIPTEYPASPTARVTSEAGENKPYDCLEYGFSWDAPFDNCDHVSDDEQSFNAKEIVTPTCSPTISPILNGPPAGSLDATPNRLEILLQMSPSPIPRALDFTNSPAATNAEELEADEMKLNSGIMHNDLLPPSSPFDLPTESSAALEAQDCTNNLRTNENAADDDTQTVPSDYFVKRSYTSKQSLKTQEIASKTFVNEDEYSIQGCLSQFTCVEMMAGNNKVGCSTCTERQNKGKEGKTILTVWSKQLLIRSAPPVLILHLKRFQVLACSSRKLSKHVAFPFTLDLTKFCAEPPADDEARGDSPSPSLRYDLYGLVEHSGHLNGGHYVAYVKVVHKENTQWFCISDSRVTQVSQSTVSECQAYLLFYSRIGS